MKGTDDKMRVIKRNGEEVTFDLSKISDTKFIQKYAKIKISHIRRKIIADDREQII